jgi:hypothetical protein
MAITINGTTGIAGVDGSAGTPAVQGTDTNTGVFFPAADTIAFGEGGAEVARFDSSGRLLIGQTSGGYPLDVAGGNGLGIRFTETSNSVQSFMGGFNSAGLFGTLSNHPMMLWTNNAERARITSAGDLLVGKTGADTTTAGCRLVASGVGVFVQSADQVLILNRLSDDGSIVSIRQASTEEGTISVSGTTVSYNGGHLSRWAQMPGTKDDTLLKGTVMSNLDEMNVYTDAEGNPVDNEQLNKVKVSDVEGDVNVAGVFVNWTQDEAHQVDEINMAMTGDMIIRIAQGVVVQKGDLLMSAGDGTAKPQEDDIVRSKTVAKVTSNHVTCTYEDGSYCVPCVLMAC